MFTSIKQMRVAFGIPFLWLVSLIYFSQGFRSFVWTAVSYQLKDILKLSPSASQFVASIAFFPWSIKPLYGILSDCIPIRGRKRVPYLQLATLLCLVPWLVVGFKASVRSSHVSLIIALTVQNLGSAMADVVIDAMIAEAARSECVAFTGDLQSLSWSSMAFGGISGSLLGGYALANLQIDTIFLLFAVLPTMQLLSCHLVEEAPLGSNVFKNNVKSRRYCSPEKHVGKGNAKTLIDSIDPQQKLDGPEISNGSTLRRRKRNRKNNKAINKSKIKQEPSVMGFVMSLKLVISNLYRAFRQPIILRPMAWFFFAHITVPNLSTVMFYYQTGILHLEASFLGTARVIGWFGLMVGTFAYNHYLKRMKLRRILMLAHVGLAASSLSDLVLVSRLNVQYGISDQAMVLWGSALSDAINQLKMMPFLIISGQLCPPGIEGTLFALFMSINNMGSTLSSFVGAGLASILNISSDSFDNLFLGILIQVICSLIPVGFLFLIPRDATGLST